MALAIFVVKLLAVLTRPRDLNEGLAAPVAWPVLHVDAEVAPMATSDDGDELRWNNEPDRCDNCGRPLETDAGYRFYADDGMKVLCPSCYQQRLTADSGGRTHDLIAEVDGGSG
jgi:hypothetical protein